MTRYRIKFNAVLEREIEVPDGLVWHEAYSYAQDTWGFDMLARSPATRLVSIKLDDGPHEFKKIS